jgi:hypothetical protein
MPLLADDAQPLGLPDTGVSFLDVISSNFCSFLSELSISEK